jgi:hypothetical protein
MGGISVKVAVVQVEQQLAQLQVEFQLGTLKMDIPSRGMKIDYQSDQLDIKTTQPEIQVDLSSYWYRMGMKNSMDFSQDITSRANEIALEATRTIAKDGDMVGTLPQQGNPISEIAKNNILDNNVKPFSTYDTVPGNVVDVTVNSGGVDIRNNEGNCKIVWDKMTSPTVEFDPPPSVDVYLAQKPRLEVQIVEMDFPQDLSVIDETA